MIVLKLEDGLSTYYVKDKSDLPKPNYPMPALCVDAGIFQLDCDSPFVFLTFFKRGDGYWQAIGF